MVTVGNLAKPALSVGKALNGRLVVEDSWFLPMALSLSACQLTHGLCLR